MLGMDNKEARDRLGLPDEIVRREDRMRSRIWICSTCRHLVAQPTPIPAPASCPRCGGIAFKMVRTELQ
jgi:rubrerythrin